MYFRQLLNDDTACASYLFGCKSKNRFAVVDSHIDLVDEYIAVAEREGAPIVAVFETHLQADHVSGLPELVRRTGATAYLPEGAGVEFDHHRLADADVVELGNTTVQAIATPGHALALRFDSEEAFVDALVQDIPPAPARQADIVAANRAGRPLVGAT